MGEQPGDAPTEPGELPAFDLTTHLGGRVRIGGRPARSQLVVFVPMAFTPVCGAEVAALVDLWPDAEAAEVDIVVVSCDTPAVLAAWLEQEGASRALIAASDFWPHGEASRAFGAFDPVHGHPERITIAVHRDGRARLVASTGAGEPRPLKEHRRGLRWLAEGL